MDLQLLKIQDEGLSVEPIRKMAKITDAELPFVTAKESVSFYSLGENDRYNECLQAITKVFFDLNKDTKSPSAKEEIQKLTIQLLNDLQSYFMGIRIGELNLCFSKGIRGDYGEYFGVNVVTFHKWLKSFESDLNRLQALDKIRMAKMIDTTFAPKEPTDQDYIACIISDHAAVRSGNEIQPFTIFYDWMYKNYDGFKPDPDEREEVMEFCRARITAELRERKVQKYANKEKIQSEIEYLADTSKVTPELVAMCKVEYYKRFLASSPILNFNNED
jgi:hypothetical protein